MHNIFHNRLCNLDWGFLLTVPMPARAVFTDLGNGYISYVELENKEQECRFLWASEMKQVQLQTEKPRSNCAHLTIIIPYGCGATSCA